MNRIFIVTHSDIMNDEDTTITGAFNSKMDAIMFIKYLRKEKEIEGQFDVEMIDPMSLKDNIAIYNDNKSISTLVATTWSNKIKGSNQICVINHKPDGSIEEEIIDLY